MQQSNIDKAILEVKKIRRQYSRMVEEIIQTEDDYELEDLIRLIGHLQATYDHLLASRAHDGDLYCVLGKHLPACLILAGEIGIEVGPIYNVLGLLTDDKIKPCSACRRDKNDV